MGKNSKNSKNAEDPKIPKKSKRSKISKFIKSLKRKEEKTPKLPKMVGFPNEQLQEEYQAPVKTYLTNGAIKKVGKIKKAEIL
ncbi:hypothetical protein E4U10_005254 [Claviceps purpurea]|nr:hypothetical protein E4U10_005254 [Claviceps purpurea]